MGIVFGVPQQGPLVLCMDRKDQKMFKYISILTLLLPGATTAHWGHVEAAAGHDHWVIGALIGAAIAAGIWGALKGEEAEEDDAETPAEA